MAQGTALQTAGLNVVIISTEAASLNTESGLSRAATFGTSPEELTSAARVNVPETRRLPWPFQMSLLEYRFQSVGRERRLIAGFNPLLPPMNHRL